MKAGSLKRLDAKGIGEACFDIAYLIVAYAFSFIFFWHAAGETLVFFAFATFILSVGDSFHLVPRIIQGLGNDSVETQYYREIGVIVSSLTMSVYYYLMLFAALSLRTHLSESVLYTFYGVGGVLLAARFVLCMLPGNKWFSGGSLKWGIIRNIPFFLLGLMTSAVFMAYDILYRGSFFYTGRMFWIGALMVLSYAFYTPVVICSKWHPRIGAMMIPKTLCYVFIMVIIFQLIG